MGEEEPEKAAPPTVLLDRAMLILNLFSEAQPDWSATEVATATRLPLPTVSRLLSQLQRLELLARSPETQRFRLGPTALRMGARAAVAYDPASGAAQALRWLATDTNETATLMVIGERREHAVSIANIDGPWSIRISFPIGAELPLHIGAGPKLLLAYAPDHEREAYLRRHQPEINDVAFKELADEIESARASGWCHTLDEPEASTWSLAAPVPTPDGIVRSVIVLSAPTHRMQGASTPDIAEKVQTAARLMATHVG